MYILIPIVVIICVFYLIHWHHISQTLKAIGNMRMQVAMGRGGITFTVDENDNEYIHAAIESARQASKMYGLKSVGTIKENGLFISYAGSEHPEGKQYNVLATK